MTKKQNKKVNAKIHTKTKSATKPCFITGNNFNSSTLHIEGKLPILNSQDVAQFSREEQLQKNKTHINKNKRHW